MERGFFESRAKAQAAIAAGLVTAGGKPITKPSDLVDPAADVAAEAPHPFVSRGGVKLAAALAAFGIDAGARVCLDIGASTGGFTDVLLQAGARKVYAIDVGQGQLHPTLADDARVVSLERTDIRHLDTSLMAEPADLATIDVSFISLKLVVPPALALLGARADLVALIKPQFEAGRDHVAKGIVRDEEVHRRVCGDIEAFLGAHDLEVLGLIPSPILGREGNREFLIGARRG